MDLTQAQALRDPHPGRLTTAGHGQPPTAVRAGKIRASSHPYTTVDDVDRALEALTR
ncbi:hypothetical protein [Streptosporangium roseum]|uniref:hypothetical protein n=1 Tax=Streptosporangium roseum TaxID=2001 RepID=UPI00331D803A